MNKHQSIKKEQVRLRHNLTDKEVRDLSETLAQNIEQKSNLEDEKKAITAEYSAKIKEKEATINGLSARISSGFEMRPRMCLVLIDRAAGLKRYYPADADPENLTELEPLKEDQLPAGYQIDIEDTVVEEDEEGVVEAAETDDPGLDIAVEDTKVPGDDLAAVKAGKLEKDRPAEPFKAEGDDGLLDFERYVKVTGSPLFADTEPDSSGKGLQIWIIWLQFLIHKANEIIGKSREMTPPAEYLKDFTKPALNRVKNWALNYIRTGGVVDEGTRLPGPPDLITDYEVNLLKPKTKEEILIDETQKATWNVWHLVPKSAFIKDEGFKMEHLTKGSLEKLKEWSEQVHELDKGGLSHAFPRLRRRSNVESKEGGE